MTFTPRHLQFVVSTCGRNYLLRYQSRNTGGIGEVSSTSLLYGISLTITANVSCRVRWNRVNTVLFLERSKSTMASSGFQYADVGINLGDPVFRGIYHGKQAHENDLEDVIQRALDAGCINMMITGSNFVESEHAINIAKKYREWSAMFTH